MSKTKTTLFAVIALVIVQLFDIAVHIATDQVEPIRIASNVVLAAWALWAVFAQLSRPIGWIVIAVFLGLNALFLAQNGLTNPDMGDAPRTPLFVLVGLSALLAMVINTQKREK